MNNIIFKTLLLKGEAGNDIQSVEKTATSGLVDTYTITLTDGSTYTFNVTNGKNIVSIEKTSSVGYVDTYTITYNDGTTDTFEITLATITVDNALSDSSTNPVENRVVTNALNTKSDNSNLATIESGTTASQAYTVGDYLVYNGQLCKVISAIAQGDTLTVGTNIEVTTSGGELTRLNSNLTAYIDHPTQVGNFNTPLVSTTDGWFCVYGRSASGNFVEVLDGDSPMWSGFLYSDGNNGSCSPLLIGKAGHTYTLNVVSGGSYDTHFIVYR